MGVPQFPQVDQFQQQQPQTIGVQQQQQQPMLGGQDPQSVYLQHALQSMGGMTKTQQQGSVGGLGANLMADALLQYGLHKRQQQLAMGGQAGAQQAQSAAQGALMGDDAQSGGWQNGGGGPDGSTPFLNMNMFGGG